MFRSLLVSLSLILTPVQMAQAKDLALIIGIDDYLELPSLNKAIEDATGYRELFQTQGYEVEFLTNPDNATFRLELARFYDRIEPGDTVVFIYSGHGWSDGALNYLVPADTPDQPSATIAAELTVPLKNGVNGILDRITARGAGLTVAVIDACRDNPFTGAETRALGLLGGLAPIEPPSGTFIVYSAASNQTALDRLGEADDFQYSVFTRFFLPNLRDMGDLRRAIVETRTQVRTAANIIGHRQRPAYYDELTGTSCLFGNCVAPVQAAAISESQATAMWSLIGDTTDPTVLRSFITRFETTDPDLTQLALRSLSTLDVEVAAVVPDVEPEIRAQVADVVPTEEMQSDAQADFDEAQQRIANSDGEFLRFDDLENLQVIPPEIQELTKLRRLDLSNTSVTDISPLAGLNSLTHLDLSNVALSDIRALANLLALEELDLSNTLVSDITMLYPLVNLSEPAMTDTPVETLRASARLNLDVGYNFLDGNGVAQDSEQAFLFFQQAYAKYDWNGEAADMLGYMYEEGQGVDEDDQRAIEFFKIGIERRNGNSAFYLGLMYEWGEGLEENNVEAARLYILSLSLGDEGVIYRAEDREDRFATETALAIQSSLKELGYYSGAIDGDLGPRTRAAMLALCDCED